MTAQAVLASIETFDRQRITVIRHRDGERGWSTLQAERQQRDGTWMSSGSKIVVPNCAIFLLRDALDRSCALASGDKK